MLLNRMKLFCYTYVYIYIYTCLLLGNGWPCVCVCLETKMNRYLTFHNFQEKNGAKTFFLARAFKTRPGVVGWYLYTWACVKRRKPNIPWFITIWR